MRYNKTEAKFTSHYILKRFFSCLVPRRLSFDENVRAKDPSHGPLRFITCHSFRARLCHAENEAPEEEAAFLGSLLSMAMMYRLWKATQSVILFIYVAIVFVLGI